MQNTILSKIENFGSAGTPIIVQDNARSFASQFPPTSGKKKKRTNQETRHAISPKLTRDENNLRWGSSMELYPHENLSIYSEDSTFRCQQERWSNGIMDNIKLPSKVDERFYSKGSLVRKK